MTSLRISVPYLQMEWAPESGDRDAAWALYVELLTRIATQPLEDEIGDEAAALASVHALFGITREIIRRHGRGCMEFTKIAVVILNQKVRPFTAKWHRAAREGAFDDPARRRAFRDELKTLRAVLVTYTGMLAQMAGVEDLTDLERV